MNTFTNRWTLSVAWVVGMLIVWFLFVPRPVSVTTFFLLVAIGLVISMFGAALFKDGHAPRSVGAIIVECDEARLAPKDQQQRVGQQQQRVKGRGLPGCPRAAHQRAR